MTNQDEKIISEIAGHYRETPLRAAKAIYDITAGYRQNPDKIATQAIFEHDGSRIVIVKDIEFYSMCEHHILPFFGKIAVGYIPKGKMIGLSKLARIVDCYARRLQVQERLTSQICKLLTTSLPNEGVIVACEAGHLCMKMRGVEKQESTTVTFDYSGKFVEDYNIRSEFLSLIKS